MKENKFYVYCHYDENDIPRYIGKGYRKSKSYARAFYFKFRNDEWYHIFPLGKPSRVEILEENLSQLEVNEKENNWINHFGMIKSGGTLVNQVYNLSYLEMRERKKNWYDRYYSVEDNIIKRKRYEKVRSQIPRVKELKTRITKKWIAENNDRVRELRRAFYQRHREEILIEQRIKHRKSNMSKEQIQKLKEYNEKHREQIRANAKNFYEENKERLHQKRKEYYQKNKEKENQKAREYYQKNKEKIDEQQRLCRIKRKEVNNGK
jgi:hypothetical protein